MDVDSSSQEEVSAVQVYWTPNLGCNLRVDLNTGVPEYDNYLKSASWITRRALRTGWRWRRGSLCQATFPSLPGERTCGFPQDQA